MYQECDISFIVHIDYDACYEIVQTNNLSIKRVIFHAMQPFSEK